MQNQGSTNGGRDQGRYNTSPLRVRVVIRLLVLLALRHVAGVAQPLPDPGVQSPDASGSSIGQYPASTISVSMVQRGQVLGTKVLDLGEDVKAIVQFTSPPLSRQQALSKKGMPADIASSVSRISSEHALFRADVTRLEHESSLKMRGAFSAANTQIRFEYMMAINGVAITAKRSLLEDIRTLPYVRSISEDYEAHTVDDESDSVVHADTFWQQYGIKGDSIIIGILDTGIDYFHEALGGAAFPNNKVIGGYDFVNNDPDPMDDNGHGTHVAGIAAGDGPPPSSLQGVAPKARLMAFKVLDAKGVGCFSQIIAGIERALNPDGDPFTNDAVDVMNLSLGGAAGPNSALSEAVNNAVSDGVVCVVAAGNSGPGYMSVTSPGDARSGLSVGAVDNSGSIAYFSSRGPSSDLFDMKPDVVAPGVGILSAKSGGGYIRYSGTSMATPHVTGIAALLRQLHPAWTPEEIKALIMESSRDEGYDCWTQGCGMVDVSQAAGMDLLITPASVNFGLDDANQAVWVTSDTLVLSNKSPHTQHYTLSPGPVQSGLTVSVQPASVTVQSGSTAQIIVTLSVDNTVVPFAATPPSYSGTIVARSSSGGCSVAVPFVFTKVCRLALHFDVAPFVVVVHNNRDQYFMSAFPGNDLCLYPPAGTYDVIVRYTGAARQIVREGVDIRGDVSLDIAKSEARNQVFFSTLDAASSPLPFDNFGLTLFVNKNSGFGISTAGAISDSSDCSKVYFSDVSPQYTYELKTSAFSAASHFDYYEFPFRVDGGISNPMIVQNRINQFKRIDYSYTHPQAATTLCFIPYFYRPPSSTACGYRYNTYFPFPQSPYKLQAPFTLTAYYLPSPGADYNVPYSYQDVYDISSGANLLYSTAMTTVSETDTLTLGRSDDPIRAYAADTIDLALNGSPPRWNGKVSMGNSSAAFITPLYSSDVGLFLSPAGDVAPKTVNYTAYSGGMVVNADSLSNAISAESHTAVAVSPGSNELRFTYDSYTISGTQGHAMARLRFSGQSPDVTPPTLKYLQVPSCKKNGSAADTSPDNIITVSVADDQAMGGVQCYIRPMADTIWKKLSCIDSADRLSFSLPAQVQGGLYSLRIAASDASNNTLDYTLEPAFTMVSLALQPSIVRYDTVNYGNSAIDSVTLTTSGIDKGTKIDVTSSNPAFTGPANALYATDSGSIRIGIVYRPDRAGPQTGTMMFTAEGWGRSESLSVAGVGFVSLPSLQSVNVVADSSCYKVKWEMDTLATSYRVELSTDSMFRTMDPGDSVVSDTFAVFHGLRDSIWYYCRVRKQTSVSQSPWSVTVRFATIRTSVALTVSQGWNLLSLPVDGVDDTRRRALFPSAISDAFGFNGSYVPVQNLKSGYGYWVKFAQGGPIVLSGLSTDSATVEVSKGWNMIGPVLHPVPITSIVPVETQISSQFCGYSDHYYVADTLYPGRAYWVKVRTSGRLEMNSGSCSGAALPQKRAQRSLNCITLEGPAGEGSLYFQSSPGSDVSRELFELPPRAPGDNLDVRFATGSMFAAFADIMGKEAAISISPDSVRLRLTWNFTADTLYDRILTVGGKDFRLTGSGSIDLPDEHSHIVLRLEPSANVSRQRKFALEQNFPNPFNPTTTIRYSLPEESHVSLKVYNELGEEVSTIIDGDQHEGERSVNFNGERLPSGIYFIKLQTQGFCAVKRMTLIK